MRLQSTTAACGPAALSNALAAMGITRSEDECGKLCRCTATDGTSHRNMIRAVRSIDGLMGMVIEEQKGDVAFLRLADALRTAHPLLLLVDNWEHWIAAVGMLGGRVLVADSADNELILSMDFPTLVRRWGCHGVRKPFWAVLL